MRKSSILSILGVIVLAMALVPHLTVEASKPVPVIVAKQVLSGQVGSFSPITLFTPSADGDYRVSIYLDAATVSTGKAIIVDWHWTDDNASQFSSVSLNDSQSPHAVTRFVDVIHVTSGNAITLQPGVNFNDTLDTYNVYVTVEEL